MGCGSSSSAQVNVDVASPTEKPAPVHEVIYVGYPGTQQQQPVINNINTKVVVEQSVPAAATKKEAELPVSVDMLHRYNDVLMAIAELETKNVIQQLKQKMDLSIDLKNQAIEMNDEYKQLEEKTQKELQDNRDLKKLGSAESVMSYLEDQVSFDAKMSKEQEEYIQAKAKMEDCYVRLINLQTQQKKIESEVKELQNDRNALEKLCKEQDNIFGSLFNGAYGSELEYQLERELDKQQCKKQKIESFYQKWKDAEFMAHRAFHQLTHAYGRWQTVLKVPNTPEHKKLRLQIAKDARSNLVAASQNLTSINRSLSEVKLPYCNLIEISTLDEAIFHIYEDIYDTARHSEAGKVYKATRDRCRALIRWINLVIEGTIKKELENCQKACKDKKAKLQAERSKLVKEKVTGKKVDREEVSIDSGIDTNVESRTSGVAAEAEKIPEAQDLDQQIKAAQEKDDAETEKIPDAQNLGQQIKDVQEKDAADAEKIPQSQNLDQQIKDAQEKDAADAEKIPGTQNLNQQIKDAQEDAAAKADAQDLNRQIKDAQKADVPDGGDRGKEDEAKVHQDVQQENVHEDELAPAPNQEELFGNLESDMAEYDKQREEYARVVEANRERQQADFQLRLKWRRSRRRRMMAQEQELNELIQKEKAAAAIEVPNRSN